MPERLNGPAWRAGVPSQAPRVRISPPPQCLFVILSSIQIQNMSIEGEPKPFDRQSELPKQAPEQNEIEQHLEEYLELKEGATEKIELLKAKDLPKKYQAEREFFHDERLDKVTIAVVPDDLWTKKSQPSESSAEKQLILIKEGYFEKQENPDEIAWLCHELAHCQNFLDTESSKEYQKNMQKFVFEDIAQYTTVRRKDLEQELSLIERKGGNEQTINSLRKILDSTDKNIIKRPVYYPNNPVEQHAFTSQFQFLKNQGKSREDILAMISKHYDKKDFPFFNRLLDSIYEK